MDKKYISMIFYILVILIGIYLLAGMVILNIIFMADLPYELLSGYLDKFDCVFYSLIPYDMNIFIMLCVPFIDLVVVLKALKSSNGTKRYWWAIFIIYTSFFLLRLPTLSA